ncbi:hypothetical protein FQZ97_1036480 [compost metagenome]
MSPEVITVLLTVTFTWLAACALAQTAMLRLAAKAITESVLKIDIFPPIIFSCPWRGRNVVLRSASRLTPLFYLVGGNA